MYFRDASGFDADDYRVPGPLVLGVPWLVPPSLVHAAAELSGVLDVPLVCAFVDPASYLTEWEESRVLAGASLDPAVNEESAYPSETVRSQIEGILGPGRSGWSFRVLTGPWGRPSNAA